MNVFVVIVFLVLIIYYFRRKNKYWCNKGVETPEPKLIFGNMYDVVFNKIGRSQLYDNLYHEYKAKGLKYCGIYTFVTPVLILIDPDLVKRVLQTDFQYFTDRIHYVNEKNEMITGNLFRLKGEKWRQLRMKLTPTFTSGKMKNMFKTMSDCSEALTNVFDQLVSNNEKVDIRQIALRYTTDVIVSCAFGVDCNTLEDPSSEFIKYRDMIIKHEGFAEFKEFFSQSFPMISDIIKLKLVPNEVKTFLKDLVLKTIEAREVLNIQRLDFMALLIKLKKRSEDQHSNNTVTLSIDEIIAQVYIFFLAGYETSSTTLTFCFFELALNTNLQDKLRDEIRCVLEEYNGEITYEGLTKMTYMDMVIKETLRKYPPLSSLNRKCVKTYKVPNSNLVIDKNTNILIPVLSIQRDKEYYPNPMKFDPERFCTKERSATWLAFGEGPRNCIGMRFGLMQVKIALTSIVSKFKFTVSSGNQLPLKSVGVFVSPQEDILLDVTNC